MRTTKAISTIWYGSEEFLKMKLDSLILSNDLLFYAYVYHYAEEDEKKDHIHVYIVPDGQLDTSQLTNELTEYDMTNVKPIKPLPYSFSKFGDWYLYDSHNIAYLASKGQTRKYHYGFEDFRSSNVDYLRELVHTIDMSKINRIETVKRAVENGETFESLVSSGQIPVQLIHQYQKAFDLIQDSYIRTYRGEYENHEENEENEAEPASDNDNLPF